ncbi:MAG: hypothetical protein KGQ52_02175 [Alphaproteobacteria bacterium]|nr:hypothetical protein [Alphaproteobacteria bacterium]
MAAASLLVVGKIAPGMPGQARPVVSNAGDGTVRVIDMASWQPISGLTT